MVWQTKTLGEVAYTAGRIGWKGLTAKEYTESGPYFLSVHSLNYGDFVDFRDAFHISDTRYEESPEIMLQPNDILICKDGAGIGKTGIVKIIPGRTSINSSLLLIRALQDVESKFLYYKLCSPSFQRIVQERIEGATTPHLYQREIKLFPIFFPPISEQKHIVALLDTVFADLEQTRVKTEQNLKNARELFDSFLQQVFSQKGESWVEKVLGDIADVSTGGTPLKTTSEFWDGDIPWYSSGELNDTYTLESKNKITELGLSGSNAKLLPQGALLIGMYDTAALKMSILDRDGTFNQAVAGVKPNPEINLEFILHSINVIKPELLKLRRGVRQKNLNQSKIKNIPIRLPTISEQLDVVAEINEIKEKTKSLVDIYNKKLDSIDELKKSILQKAFSGELTSTAE